VDPPTSLKKEWVLTKEALDTFLARLDLDRERAGQKYEGVRLRLLKYFQWCGAVTPDMDADETINRVARKIAEGERVYNLNAYIYGVAKLVNAEAVKVRTRNQQLSDETPEIEAPPLEEEDSDVVERRSCFDRCLQYLPDENREVITEYYRFDKGGKKIEHRKKLAARLGITLNALRILAHRIRVNLEACVRECLGHSA
jgi:DNA-directed RNA polymerase specialized sigma24 family protein